MDPGVFVRLMAGHRPLKDFRPHKGLNQSPNDTLLLTLCQRLACEDFLTVQRTGKRLFLLISLKGQNIDDIQGRSETLGPIVPLEMRQTHSSCGPPM